jgi:hypothetical protein
LAMIVFLSAGKRGVSRAKKQEGRILADPPP